uniref:ENT domain-containing protein n=1 Tax=Strongyloides papillosus TaxID=174720 RepID=A0A0N5CDI6_STREA
MSATKFPRPSNFSTKKKEKNNQNLDDVLKNLEDLNQTAFEACMRAFRAHGNLDSYQFLILSHLKYIFSITTEMAKTISRRIADDIELITIAENLNPNVDVRRNWDDFCCEQTPIAWLSFKNETFANFLRGPFSYVTEYNFRKEVTGLDEVKSLSALERLYTVKQEPIILDRFKEFFEEIGVSFSTKNDGNKVKNKCGRPKKNSVNNTKSQKSQNPNKSDKLADECSSSNASNLKTGKTKVKQNEMSYIGNLGKKEMHTMICQRVIPISETYKQKIINRSIVLRKRVTLGEMSTSGDSHTIESHKNSDNTTPKMTSSSPKDIKRRKLDSSLSEDIEANGNLSKGMPTSSVFSKTSCYKFLRKPIFSSEKKSPKIVIRPITCTKKNVYSVPRVIFKANDNTSPRKIDNTYDMVIPPRSGSNLNNYRSLNKNTEIDDLSTRQIQNDLSSRTDKELSNEPLQQAEEITIQMNGKYTLNTNLNDPQFITSTSLEMDKHNTYKEPLKNDLSKVVK